MNDFIKVIKVFETNMEGYLAITSLLPEDAILWVRNIESQGKMIVAVKDHVDLQYIAEQINRLHNSFKH